MAALPIQIDGYIWLHAEKRAIKASVIGDAFIIGLAPGGGPIMPPQQPPGGGDGKPPGIWGGGNEPFPTPPIANVPGLPPTQNPPDWPKPPEPINPPVKWKPIWAGEEHGWVVVGVIDPDIPHPVPSGS